MEKQVKISAIALKVINTFKGAILNSPTKISFVSIKGYENKFGEKSDNLINIGVSYEKAKQKDIQFLKELNVNSIESNINTSLLEQARLELISSFENPSVNRSKGQIDAYTPIIEGVKIHNISGEIYLYGYREKKTILSSGIYPVVNSKDITIAKNFLRRQLHTGKFTQFILSNINKIKANGEILEL